MNECKGIGGLLFGHKFQPRYSEDDQTPVEASAEMNIAISTYFKSIGVYIECVHLSGLQTVTEAFQNLSNLKTTYIHDICVRCGQVNQK